VKISENIDSRLRERRKYRRIEVRNSILAVLKPGMKKLGLIKDISKGGLSLKYISASPFSERISEVDIFYYPHQFYITKIPCTAVHDRILEDLTEQGFNGIQIRLCGLRFGKLLPVQEKKLNHLLKRGISMPDRRHN